MKLNSIDIDTECASFKNYAALFPFFFSVNNFEFNYLFNTNSSIGSLSYNEHFSSLKLSEITATSKQQDFFPVHFNAGSLSKRKDKIDDF